MERRIYKIDQTCRRLNCQEHEVRQKITEELANDMSSSKDINFEQMDSNTLQVILNKQGEA